MKSIPILFFLHNPSIHVIATQGRHRAFPVSQKVPFCPLPTNIHSPEVNQYSDFCYQLACLWIAYKWNHRVYSLLRLVFFAHQSLYDTHPCYCMYQLFNTAQLSTVRLHLHGYIPYPFDGHLGCCQVGSYYEECYYVHSYTYLQVDTCTHFSRTYIWRFKCLVTVIKRNCWMVFQSVCAILYSYQQGLSLILPNYRFQFSVEIFWLSIHLIHHFLQNI